MSDTFRHSRESGNPATFATPEATSRGSRFRGNDVVVFDGVCHLCSGWVQFLLRHDKAQRYSFAAMQGEAGQRLLREHGIDPSDPSSFLLLRDGVAETDSDAVISVVTGLGSGWRAAGVLRVMPRVVRDPLYRWIARNRYRLLGKRATCYLPTPEDSARFLG
jgi:predicted DCC family thiol-disulfide oxidoreductase YuxK